MKPHVKELNEKINVRIGEMLEGKLFSDYRFFYRDNKNICVQKDYYTIRNGLVFLVNRHQKLLTSLEPSSFQTNYIDEGIYNPDQYYNDWSKVFPYIDFEGFLKKFQDNKK